MLLTIIIWLIKILAALSAALVCFILVTKFSSTIAQSIKDLKESIAKIKRNVDSKKAAITLPIIIESIKKNPKSPIARYFKISIAILFFLLTLLFLGINAIIFAFIFGFGGYILPGTLIKYFDNKKMNVFEEQLMDALGTISTSMRAGSSLIQAMEVVTAEAEPPLKEEFQEVLRQVQLGNSIDKALKDMCERIPSQDLRLAVLAITVTREYGGNLGENLMRISSVMRERKKIRGKIDAITAQGRLSGWIVTFVPLLLLFVLRWMEPEMFGLMFTTFLGNMLLGVAVILVSIGNYVIMKIVKIDI